MLKTENKSYLLAEDTITRDERALIASWIKDEDRLTKGDLTIKFENDWAKWNGSSEAVFVNSGSSANLIMLYAEICSSKKDDIKIVVPAISWSTTVSPAMQLGMEIVLCDADKNTLGVDTNHLEDIFKTHNPDILFIVHVLGHINDMETIAELCDKYNVTLFEDCCEAVGTQKNGKKVGNYGKAGTFSFYYGHHISTIEGGMVVSSDKAFTNILKSIRSHGWSRDMEPKLKNSLKKQFDIDDFMDLFTFYYPGFNVRSTDLNAFIGLLQLKKVDEIIKRRYEVYLRYKSNLEDYTWIQTCDADVISNFGLGLIINDKRRLLVQLNKENIEHRPLLCGSMGQQPFWIKKFGIQILPFASKVHKMGIYLPSHHNLSLKDVDKISEVVLNSINS